MFDCETAQWRFDTLTGRNAVLGCDYLFKSIISQSGQYGIVNISESFL